MKKLFFLVISLFCINTSIAGLDEILWNNPIGSSCITDYECGSLCCDYNNLCAAHNPNEGVSCNKSPGERCITSEFCKGEYVAYCKLYKSGTHADGTVACVMRCPAVLIKGDCKNGYCQSPMTPPIPSWDGVDCTNAIDP